MLLRKINAGLSLLSTLLLLVHAIGIAVWMLSRGSIAIPVPYTPWILAGAMALHAFISIDLVLSTYMETESRGCKSYPRLNVSTVVQRVSGLLLILFTALHIAGTVGYTQPPPFVHAVLPPVFFAVALLHTAVSTGKALITLGIGNAKFVKSADVAVKALCGATLIADVIGFYLHVC